MADKRVNYVLDTALVDRLKAYADRFGISQTSAVSILLTQGLDSADLLKSMPDMDYLMHSMAKLNAQLDSGEIVVEKRGRARK